MNAIAEDLWPSDIAKEKVPTPGEHSESAGSSISAKRHRTWSKGT